MNSPLQRLARAAAPLLACCAIANPALAQDRPTSPPSPCTPSPCTPGTCTPGTCTIRVAVNDCQQPGGITVDKPYVSADSAVNMRWEIVTEGFVFATDGIRFEPPNPQFEPRQSPRPNEFRIHNRKSQSGDFYYHVNVQGCLPMDPWMQNH